MKSQRGFTLFEVLVALTILGLGAVSAGADPLTALGLAILSWRMGEAR
jgi:prepilin-type N-terminal cleavage/methylation domain-containing protein